MKKWLQLSITSLFALAMAHTAFGQDHLLITEFAVEPTAGEFIEIYNPTDQTIDLSNYYISDATFAGDGTYYYKIVQGNGGGGGFGDFNARFPDGASIAPGEHQTIALAGSEGFNSTYGVDPTYELFEYGTEADGIADMREASEGSINGQGGLSNNGEFVVLYYWDGASDLVQDIDYLVWGDKAEAVDKSGVSIDGPDDGEETSTYANDTAIDDQTVVNADNDDDENPHDFGMTAQRRLDVEDLENWSGGNGITGHDETGENTSYKGGIWSINEPATPGRRALTPYAPADSLTIEDVQFVRQEDIGADINDDSPFNGDTLTVTGIVMHGIRDIFVGARWGIFVQDPRGGPWSGFFVIQNDTAASGTQFTAALPGDVVKFTGVMSEFPTGSNQASISQFALLTDPITPIEFVDFAQPLPDPVLLTPGDLGLAPGGASADPQLSERWEGVLARFEGLTVTANGLAGNTLNAGDETGTIILDDYFNAVNGPVTNNGGVWPGLPPGTKVNVTGFIRGGTSSGFITINPRSLDDVEIASSPPEISNVSRDPAVPTSSQSVTVSATIADAQTTVASADLSYRVDGGAFTKVAMVAGADNGWTGEIPAQADGAFVEYFLESADDGGASTTAPGDTSAAKFFYFVRDGGLTIQDIQFVPDPLSNDASSFVGLEVTVTGVVTSDSSDFAYYWIQDGNEPWSGVLVNDLQNNVKLGDNVTVTGTVQENFGSTRINNVTNVNVNSTNNPVPDPVVVNTGDIATGAATAEQWEGVLVRVENVAVSNPFADGSSNFGEFYIDDGSGEVRVNDNGNHRGNLDTTYAEGDSLLSVTGLLDYSFSNFKIEPRNLGDIVRKSTAVGDEPIPYTFDLGQNYPNPFNPETTISYQIAKAGAVKITIYNLIGQKIRTLVDHVSSAGSYKVVWDGRGDDGLNVASGVYFYKMQTTDFVKVNKMLLMK